MIKNAISRFLQKRGYEIVKTKGNKFPDFDNAFNPIYEKAKHATMTSPERMYSLYKAIQYISDNKIEGDVVECGVWRGGSSMMAAMTLLKQNDTSRQLYMYDTYEGMSDPTDKDVSFDSQSAKENWETKSKVDEKIFCYSELDEVKNNMITTGYPMDKIHFVKGKVEDTIPQTIPQKISLLRLDTDWYESTKHELIHLFPLLSKNGVLIIDDYGHWQGAREAVDEYFKEKGIVPLLNRIDYTGRIMIKTS